MARIAYHTDNLLRLPPKGKQVFSERLFRTEILSRKGFADDNFACFFQALVFIKYLAAQEGDAEGGEVSGIRPAVDGVGSLIQGKRRVLGNGEAVVSPVAFPGNRSRNSRGSNTGQSPKAIEQSFKKSRSEERRVGKGGENER